MSLFFLSYAHTDGVDGYVREFYRDLCRELAGKTGLDVTAVGFQDVGMRSGTDWPAELTAELATCKVFVPLYSPSYFASEACGREWQIFTGRFPGAAGESGPLVPVLWEPEKIVLSHVPAAAEARQYHDFGLDYPGGAAVDYLKSGLTMLVRNKEHPAVRLYYTFLLGKIAIEVIEAAGRYNVSPSSPTPIFEDVPAAFGAAVLEPALQRTRGTSDVEDRGREGPAVGGGGFEYYRAGPRHVHLVVAAGTEDEVDETVREHYGARSEDWAPFFPMEPDPLVRLALSIAVRQDFTPYPSKIDNRLAERITAAKAGNELIVLLVDPRAVTNPAYAAAVAPYDDVYDMNSGAVVVWNIADTSAGTQAGGVDPAPRPDIESALRRVLVKKMTKGDRTFHPMILSVTAFERTLLALLTDLRQMLLDSGRPERSADATRHIGRPRLTGPVVS